MVRILVFGVLALVSGCLCTEEDNLRNALNSIASRQKQLSNYYSVPNKNTEQELQFDDNGLMHLDDGSRDFDVPYRDRISYGYQKPSPPSKNLRFFDEDRIQQPQTDDYENYLKERLLERLMLDILETDDETQNRAKQLQKKSFFREREINEIPENLQNLYSDSNIAEGNVVTPSSFRERSKSKLRANPHRRLAKPYDDEDIENEADYVNLLNSLSEKYRIDPETMANDDAENLLKYLTDKEYENNDYDYLNALNQNAYFSKNKKRQSHDHSTRYRSGNIYDPTNRFAIQKRSADSGEKRLSTEMTTTATRTKNETSYKIKELKSKTNKTKPYTTENKAEYKFKLKTKNKTERGHQGQKEMPIDMKSLKPLNIQKKSVDWSTYFGVDKRQKKSNVKAKEPKNDVLLDQYIQSYILQSVRNSAFNNPPPAEYRYFPKRDRPIDDQVLETDDDLKNAEDIIIGNVLKYTGSHEGIADPAEINRFKTKVIDELGAAYNLEKLRKELLDDTMRTQSNRKRVAIKKENVEIPTTNSKKLKIKYNGTSFNNDSQEKQYLGLNDYDKRRYETNKIYVDECPVLSEVIEKCVQFSNIMKDRDGTLAPFCTMREICHICGTKKESKMCDVHFISDVSSVCGDAALCQNSVRRALNVLQGLNSKLIPHRCDSCIADVLQISSYD